VVAGHEQAAGGDWFDAIPLADGRVALVVGDVVGHGVAASAAMGQLRAVLAELLAAEEALGHVLLYAISEQLAAHGQDLTLVTAPASGVRAVLDLVRLDLVTG
jgi:serine phosphatase RsbU (regulator of sigma subunit)